MNACKYYNYIVYRAQQDREHRQWLKQTYNVYYELHHILPKSLGGLDTNENLVMLTLREHFICHLLLAKMYPDSTIEHDKMMCAILYLSNRMCKNAQLCMNSRSYETIRHKALQCLKTRIAGKQQGQLNSCYGTSWYTNAYDGSNGKFKSDPGFPWYKGRHLFRGESNILCSYKQTYAKSHPNVVFNATKPHVIRKTSMRRLTLVENKKQETYALWNKFHQGTYDTIKSFERDAGLSEQGIRYLFKRYIPRFITDMENNHHGHYGSNVALVDCFN